MIYLENNTKTVEIYIPKDDEAIGGGSHGGSYQQGFQDGYASGYTDGVESTEGYEQGYADGFNDGHSSGITDGYSSGYADGEQHQKSLLSSTAITSNGEYTNANGWSSVTVNVPQGQGYEEGYEAGYEAGHQAGQQYGYEIGYADGVVDGKYQITSTFTSLSVDSNGNYGSVEHPLTAVTVQVPQTGHTDQEMQERYNLGYSDGVTHQKSLLSTTAITANGEYSSENGWEEITVNVPQNNPNIEEEKTFTATTNGTSSITPSPIWEILFTSKESVYDNSYHFTIDGTISSGYYGQAAYRLDYNHYENYGYVLIKIDQNGGLELDTSNYDQEAAPVHLYYINGRYDFSGNWITASNFDVHPLSNIEYYYAMSSVTITVDVPPQEAVIEQSKSYTATTNGSHTITPTGTWEVTCDTSRDDYYLFKIEGVLGSQYKYRHLYRLDYNGEEDYGYVLVVVNENGDNLALDINHYDQESHPVGYRNESDGTHFLGNPASAFTVTPLDYKEALYDAMAEVQLTVDVQPNVSSTAITENGTYEATGTGVDGWSSVTVNVPQTSYGELYCLACENARFEIASGNGLTSRLILTQASAQFLGSYRGELLYNGETMASWGASEFNSGDTKYGNYYYNWGHQFQPPVTDSINIIEDMEFPNFHTISIQRGTKVSLNKDGWQVLSPKSAPSVSGNLVSIFVKGYLKGANFNNTYCPLFPAVDSNGNACLLWNGQYIYPAFGKCYPVYKRTVDGVDKYVVVTELT